MQCFVKKEYKSMLDVENVETTGESSLCTFIGMKHINFTYVYVYHTNVFEAENIYKKTPRNVSSPIFF